MNDLQRGPSAPLASLAFYASPPHDCGYLPERSAVTLFADPKAAMDSTIYSALAEQGWVELVIASSPTISLGRWKPVTCSSPSSVLVKVFTEPERIA